MLAAAVLLYLWPVEHCLQLHNCNHHHKQLTCFMKIQMVQTINNNALVLSHKSSVPQRGICTELLLLKKRQQGLATMHFPQQTWASNLNKRSAYQLQGKKAGMTWQDACMDSAIRLKMRLFVGMRARKNVSTRNWLCFEGRA